MTTDSRPYRSVLYIPGSNARALEKARTLPVDAIIFDLEDAVAPDEKINARNMLVDTLTRDAYGSRAMIVRVNGADTEWGADDLAAFAGMDIDAILLPKVDTADMVAAAAKKVSDAGGKAGIWAMMETPKGILNAADIATAPGMGGFVMGTNDLAKDVGCRFRADRLPMMTALQISLMAARSAGIPCIDGVYNAFKDTDGLRAECEQGRDLGMDGKTLIHPAQVAVANEVFAPSEAEVDLARRQIAAFEEAMAAGKGVAVLDGRIVENLHVDTARQTLAKLEAITALEG